MRGLLTIEAEKMPDPGVIRQFFAELPEKALHLSVRVLLAALFFLLGVQLIKLVRRIVRKSMQRAGAEVGAVQFVDSFMKAALYVLLLLMIASSLGVDAASIVALLGSAGVAVGLAVQGSLSNLAGGVLILLLKPFKVGDYIQESLTGKEGTVTEIQIFYTELLTFDNKAVILPNGSLANNSIVNMTAQPERRMDISVSVSYRADLKKAKEVLLQVLEEDEAALKNRDRLVFVDELGDSGVRLGVRCWFLQADFWPGKWRIAENCKLALDRAGIEIPYPQMDVHLRESQGTTVGTDRKTGGNFTEREKK
ncbi:MAG: mechanosensitive ion channel family protein [Roseburia sp.]|nr:mechanosensitive ion channel family protein [Roseburia sp.]MCM1097374.1 mechanosensitive ion channel family protein [Ruminococcus flavefaciens]